MFIVDYLHWHYKIAPFGVFSLMKNFLIATWHRFLIPKHFATLLSPWRRVKPQDIGKPQSLSDKVLNFAVDIYFRILAALVRLTIIFTGLAFETAIFVLFLISFFVFVFWPVVFVVVIVIGLSLIF